MNIKKHLIQKSKHIYRHTKNRIIYIFASLLNTPYSKSSKPSLTYPLTKILRGSIIYACLRNVKSSLQRLVKILLKANPFPALSNPATHKGEAMKTQFKATQRLAALGAITLLSAFLIACGGGGGGGAVGGGGATAPVAPTVPPVTTTGPVITPPVTVSVTCPNTNPVVVVQGSNANDYTNCPVVVSPVVTAAAACAASGQYRELLGTATGSTPYCAIVLPAGAYVGETATFNGRTLAMITPEWPSVQVDGTTCPNGPALPCFRAAAEAGKVIFVQSGIDSNIITPIFKRVAFVNMAWSLGNIIDKRTGIIAYGDTGAGWNFSNQKIDYYKGSNFGFEVHGNGDSLTSCYEVYPNGTNIFTSGWQSRPVTCTP